MKWQHFLEIMRIMICTETDYTDQLFKELHLEQAHLASNEFHDCTFVRCSFVETTFEGYGQDGIALFIECATDNNQRTVSSIRSYFNKHGGSLGKDGCLEFIFERKGIFDISAEGLDEEVFTLEMIDGGAEDVEFDDGAVEVSCAMEDFGNVQKKLQELEIEPKESGLHCQHLLHCP